MSQYTLDETSTQQGGRVPRKRNRLVTKNFNEVHKEYEKHHSLQSFMKFDCEEGWEKIANEFVLAARNSSVKKFIGRISDSKIEVEKEMRRFLDRKLMHMREQKLRACSISKE